jgi:hypothetical protein
VRRIGYTGRLQFQRERREPRQFPAGPINQGRSTPLNQGRPTPPLSGLGQCRPGLVSRPGVSDSVRSSQAPALRSHATSCRVPSVSRTIPTSVNSKISRRSACGRDRPAFEDAGIASETLAHFLRVSAADSFAVLAYCLMPDHAHLLVRRLSATSDLRLFVKTAKRNRVARIASGAISASGRRAISIESSETMPTRAGTQRTSSLIPCDRALSQR